MSGEPSVPDELIDLYIATSHPGKGEIETRRAALAAFAKRYGQTVREQTAKEIEDETCSRPCCERARAIITRGES